MNRWLFPIHVLDARDPVFAFETRGIHHRATRQGLRKHLRGWLLILAGLLGLWWLSLLATAPSWEHISASYAYAIWLFVASVLANLPLDLACITAGLHTVNHDIVAGRWDLLRLTPLTAARIFHAKHAVVQVRVWRVSCFVAALRINTVLITGITFVLIRDGSGRTSLTDYLDSLAWDSSTLITLLLTLPIFALVYMLEPFWRMAAMTALAIWVSRHKRVTAALIEGLGWIIGLVISQVMVLAIIFFILVQIASSIFTSTLYAQINSEAANLLFQCIVAVACALTGLIIYQYYRVLAQFSLRRSAEYAEAE